MADLLWFARLKRNGSKKCAYGVCSNKWHGNDISHHIIEKIEWENWSFNFKNCELPKTCPSFTKQDDLSFQFYSRKNVHCKNLLQLFAAVRHKTCDITADTTRGYCYRVKLEQHILYSSFIIQDMWDMSFD